MLMDIGEEYLFRVVIKTYLFSRKDKWCFTSDM